jgi:N-acetylmuramoyl-L-alanine amidase
VSYWRGHTALNARSIGIEIVNPGHEFGYRDFPVLQLAAVCDLCLLVLARHQIAARNVVAHSDVAPERKEDPGERFDWRALAENGVGLWPRRAPDLGTTGAIRDAVGLRPVRATLAEIGYRVAPEGALDPALSAVLRAFQRHWRPEAVTGQADDGTLARLLGMQELVRSG